MTSQQVSYAQLPVSYDSCHFSPCEEDNLTIWRDVKRLSPSNDAAYYESDEKG